MRIDCLSIFPEIIKSALASSIPGKAQERGILLLGHHDIREYSVDKHHKTDDIPYGGGVGMVFKPEPVAAAIEALRQPQSLVIHPSPAAPRLTQADVIKLSEQEHLIFLASRYEGMDQRILDTHVDLEFSLGDYVISGGELAVAMIIDAIVRLLPGAISKEESFREDSFFNGLLDYPHYTRPADFQGNAVPEVLLSGHHENIRRWRKERALERTLRFRPDLLDGHELDKEGRAMLRKLREEAGRSED